MKVKKFLIALSLVGVLTSTNPLSTYAYSNEKLDSLEDELDDYLDEKKELEMKKYTDEGERIAMENYYQYLRIQKIIHEMPTEYYYDLVDNISIDKTLKDVLKACIDDDMTDAARESIVYATIAENEWEILHVIMNFFESRYNGKHYIYTSPDNKYALEDMHALDDRDGLIDINNIVLIFERFSSYGDYYIFDCVDYSKNYYDEYYIITDKNKKILTYITDIYGELSFKNLDDEDIYIENLEDLLKKDGLDSKIKTFYTSAELGELENLFKSKGMRKLNDTILKKTIPKNFKKRV